MKLSDNIKKYRIEKNLTQANLAEILGISSQAVSKWETSETYPDGSLLLPLSEALGVSLDTLFGNADIDGNTLIRDVAIAMSSGLSFDEQFLFARYIGDAIQRGMFHKREYLEAAGVEPIYGVSYISNDSGFTRVSGGEAPIFSLFVEPVNGYESVIGDGEEIRKVFERLSHKKTIEAILYLFKQKEQFVFEPDFLAEKCNIDESETLKEVLNDLSELRLIDIHNVTVDDSEKVLCYYHLRATHNHTVIALMLFAREHLYNGSYMDASNRSKPYIK